ncbi:MAG TPA: class I SAM-dependent methyltransferase [bacterium]|nr:class I SAM-dependent methyltransferase [bacterium]
MFTKSVTWYDAIYSWKDYKREAQRLRLLVDEHAQRPVATLLDIACGTGQHLTYLKDHYAAEGLDLDHEMLNLARQRHPGIAFHCGDMRAFDLGRRFDVVLCLFASVSYCRDMAELEQAITTMARHVNPGGLVVVEPFITPEQFKPGHVSAIFVDHPDLKIARIHTAEVADGIAVMPFHYLVGTPEGVQYFTERHEMTLFSHDQYVAAFKVAGLHVVHDAEGLMGRGLYIGVKPIRDQ